jgi:hypothetical protein
MREPRNKFFVNFDNVKKRMREGEEKRRREEKRETRVSSKTMFGVFLNFFNLGMMCLFF